MSGARVAVQARDAKKLYTFEAIYFHLQKPMDPAPNNIFELCLALPILFSLSLYNHNQGGIRFYFCFLPLMFAFSRALARWLLAYSEAICVAFS